MSMNEMTVEEVVGGVGSGAAIDKGTTTSHQVKTSFHIFSSYLTTKQLIWIRRVCFGEVDY